MARTSKTNPVVDDVVTDNVAVADQMNEEVKKTVKNSIKAEPLNDYDEIEIESLVANVSYKDKPTGNMYEWEEVGHIEYMTFGVLKNLWRNHKGYFHNMWLKPNDERVVNQFGLTKVFEKYEFLMDASNYTKKNMDNICDAISNTPNGLKISICDKVKDLVVKGEITDIHVIKALEKHLKIDLIEFL